MNLRSVLFISKFHLNFRLSGKLINSHDVTIRKYSFDNSKNPWIQKFEKYKVKTIYLYEKFVPISVRKIANRLSIGAKNELQNAKDYRKLMKQTSLQSLTYKELMNANSFKRDGFKSAIILFISVIPFGFWLLWIPIVVFPRTMFPRSFWSPTQRAHFLPENHLKRMEQYDVVISHMNYHTVNREVNENEKKVLCKITNCINKGQLITNQQLLPFKQMCHHHPFDLSNSNFLLVFSFTQLVERSSLGGLRWIYPRLQDAALNILELDKKLLEMKIENLDVRELEEAVCMRGLNGSVLSYDANKYWLNNWLKLSKDCDQNDVSFILHAMILLSYNYTELKYQRQKFG